MSSTAGAGRASRFEAIYSVDRNGKLTRLTDDGHSGDPVWGGGWIAYRRFHLPHGSDWWMSEVWLMRTDGSRKHRLARVRPTVPTNGVVVGGGHQSAVIGLRPLLFSTDGKRLLACDASGLVCPPVTIGVPDDTLERLGIPRAYVDAWGLSSTGDDVLVQASPSFGSPHAYVYSIPFGGGQPKLLVRDAAEPSWALK